MQAVKTKQIAITGGVGTGKSTVGDILQKEGFSCLDADEIAHAVVAKGEKAYREVIQAFGEKILDSKGNIERSKLAEVVFSDRKKRKILEQIVHPKVGRQLASALSDRSQTRFYLIPLLFEVGMESLFDEVWVVSCSREEQERRLKERDGWNEKEIERRIAAQLPLSVKEEKADRVIHNDGSIKNLKKAILALLKTKRLHPHQEKEECNATT